MLSALIASVGVWDASPHPIPGNDLAIFKCNAAAHVGNAYRVVPEFVEAGFKHAKYLAANGQDDEATAVLHAVISKDRYFAVKTLSDADLANRKPVLKLLGGFHVKAISQAKQELIAKVSYQSAVCDIDSGVHHEYTSPNGAVVQHTAFSTSCSVYP
jgi:hypothetical protein